MSDAKPAEKPPEAPKAPAPPAEGEVKREARKILKAYREANAWDDREDDVLMRAANGPLEVATENALHAERMATRLDRLARSHVNYKPPKGE